MAQEPSIGGLNQALAFTKAIHTFQKSEGLWLAQNPLVRAVHAGSSKRDTLARWVRQIYCLTRTYAAILQSMNPPPPVGIWIDPWRELDLLLQLGGAIGVERRDMETLDPNFVTRNMQVWLRWRLSVRSRHIAAQVCWALMEAMSPEAWTYLAKGATMHFRLRSKQLGYFNFGMRSRRRADRYAASLLTRLTLTEWHAVQEETLLVSRLMCQLYQSVGDEQPVRVR